MADMALHGVQEQLLTAVPHVHLPTNLPPIIREPWTVTGMVHIFQAMGRDFPRPDATKDEWESFGIHCALWPICLFVVGVLVAFFVLCEACRCCARRNTTLPEQYKPRRRFPLCMALLAILFAAAGSLAFWTTGAKGVDLAQNELDRALTNATQVLDEGKALHASGASATRALDKVVAECQDADFQKYVKEYVTPIRQQIISLMGQVDTFNGVIKPIPEALRTARDKSSSVGKITGVGLLVPTLVIILGCIIVAIVVLCAPRSSRSSSTRTTCWLPLTVTLLAPCILVVAALAAVQMQVGVLLGSFCIHADENTLDYINYLDTSEGWNHSIYNLSEYYILGKGNNSLLDNLFLAQGNLDDAQHKFKSFEQIIPFITDCPKLQNSTGPKELQTALDTAQQGIRLGMDLLNESNVYPFYEEAVHKELCQTLIIGLGWLVVMQEIVCLICLPVVVVLATRYLKRLNESNRQEQMSEASLASTLDSGRAGPNELSMQRTNRRS